MDVSREDVQLFHDRLVAAGEIVVAEHGRHGDGETDGPLGGPNDGTTPTGGSTDPNVPSEGTPGNAPGNPGL